MRRLGSLLVALILSAGGVLVWPAQAEGAAEGDASDVSVTRYGGAERYETSLLVAEAVAAEAGGSLSSVVLVSGERWTDAVVAAPIAGSLGAAVLMTPPGGLRDDALGFLGRVGVSSAVVVGPDGGGGAHGSGRGVTAAVLSELAEAGISARRVAGGDRFGTSVAAAGEVTPGVMPELGRTAIVASADVFADALVAGPFAARGVHPVLLSAPSELPAGVASYLAAADIEHVMLMGGTAALSADVELAIEDLGLEVTRLAGETRYDTAVKAAALVAGRYSDSAGQVCFASSTIGLARARVPFDSFSAAPLLARLCASLVLADPNQVPARSSTYVHAARKANAEVDLRIFGGNAAVSESAINAAFGCLPVSTASPPYWGTVWITPDILGPSGPSSLEGVTYAGRGLREIFDRRIPGWVTVNAYLFRVEFGEVIVEFQVNPEFGSRMAAREQVDTFAPAIGRLPSVLVAELRGVEVNAGEGRFGGNSWNRSLLIHTDDPGTQTSVREGWLEEVFLHEGAHAALDPLGMTEGWRTAQSADDGYISEYARDFPDREDIAESFLPYFALRQHPERLTAQQRCLMTATIPNRLNFFDNQQFDLSARPPQEGRNAK